VIGAAAADPAVMPMPASEMTAAALIPAILFEMDFIGTPP
jgi:hypothetical protein